MTKLRKFSTTPVLGADLKKPVESLKMAMDELGGATGDGMQRAVRVFELVETGLLKVQPDGQLGAPTAGRSDAGSGDFVRRTGDSMTGILNMSPVPTDEKIRLTDDAIRVGIYSNATNVGFYDYTNSTGILQLNKATKAARLYGAVQIDGTTSSSGSLDVAASVSHLSDFRFAVGATENYIQSSNGRAGASWKELRFSPYNSAAWKVRITASNFETAVNMAAVFNSPGSSAAAAAVHISSPGGIPGIIGFSNTGLRSDIQFKDGSVGIYPSGTSSGSTSGLNIMANGDVDVDRRLYVRGAHVNNPTANGSLVLSTASGTGFVYLRPNGADTSTGQVTLRPTGDLYTENWVLLNSAAPTSMVGLSLWGGNTAYTITMGTAADGGRVAGETTSDYNMYFNMSGGSNRGFVFRSGTACRVGIDAAGNVRAVGDVVAYSSDARLKLNAKPIRNALAKLRTINGYTFDWDMPLCRSLGFEPQNVHEHGLMAQEIEGVMSDAVRTAAFNAKYKTVNYGRTVSLVVAAAREQDDRVSKLERTVSRLSKQLAKAR